MLSKFIRSAGIALVIALIMSLIVSYFIQTRNSNLNTTKELNAVIGDVEELMNRNNEELKVIRAELDEVYLEKTRAFAKMIEYNPDMVEDFDELCRVRDMLGVKELHICDEKGVLLWGTFPDYYGFDFATSEQTKPFLEALTDSSYECAQDPQPNGATGEYLQYISIARYDKPGIVQIEMLPKKLEDALNEASPEKMLGAMKLQADMRVLLISPDGVIIGDSQSKLVGTAQKDVADFSGEGSGFAKIEDVPVYWETKTVNGVTVAAIEPQSYMYGARNQSILITALTNVIIFIILLIVFTVMISRLFISPFNSIIGDLNKIGGGNFDVKVKERTSKEFIQLSDGINSMVDSIKSMLSNSNNVNDVLKEVIGNIEANVGVVDETTRELFYESKNLSDGAGEQNRSVNTMTDVLNHVSQSTVQNATRAQNASDASRNALKYADEGSSKMEEMMEAVKEIDKSSKDISKVIKTIDDIAFQTNILALNAAVEAARAGAAGKGFAVVAEEVRNLASKSAEAAKQTEGLITASIQKAQAGVVIAKETSEKISQVAGNINESTKAMEGIAEASKIQTQDVEQLESKMNAIARSIEVTAAAAAHVTNVSEKLQVNASEMSALMKKLSVRER